MYDIFSDLLEIPAFCSQSWGHAEPSRLRASNLKQSDGHRQMTAVVYRGSFHKCYEATQDAVRMGGGLS